MIKAVNNFGLFIKRKSEEKVRECHLYEHRMKEIEAIMKLVKL